MVNFPGRAVPCRQLLLSCAALAALWLSGCGSGAAPGALPDPAAAFQSALEQASASKAALPLQPSHTGLPALSELGDPQRGPSLAAPGWYETSALHPLARMGALFSASDVTLDSNAINGLAYLVYGVAGFEPDSGPTGARFTVSGVTGQYWIGFSDFVAGRWVFSGPFNAAAEGEIPNVTPYTDPHAFVSPRGVHYFCILAPLGTVLTVEKTELGVHGGAGAPRPPALLGANAGPSGTMVGVQLSPDHLDPDFGGYLFQRAPLLGGGFATMFGGPTREPTKFDFTATNLEGYRWRACSVDTSGNQSIWVTSSTADLGPGNMPPVPHATFPQGRLFGPVELTFDLSASLDPDGDAITQYGIAIEPGGPVFSGTPEVTLTLQPGCYNIVAVAKDAAAFGFTPYRLKVYPQWEATSNVVALPELNAPGSYASLLQARVSRSPDGRLALCGQGDGFDFDVHYEVEPGLLRQWSTPLYALPQFVGEPLWHNGVLMCPFGTAESIFCAVFDPAADSGTGKIWQLDLANFGGVIFWDAPPAPFVSLSEDQNGDVWAFYQVDNLGSLDFVARNVSALSIPLTLLAGITAIESVDSELRSDGLVEVALATAIATEEFEFDPATGILTPLTVIAPAPLQKLDLELDPATGRPAVAYYAPFPTERVR